MEPKTSKEAPGAQPISLCVVRTAPAPSTRGPGELRCLCHADQSHIIEATGGAPGSRLPKSSDTVHTVAYLPPPRAPLQSKHCSRRLHVVITLLSTSSLRQTVNPVDLEQPPSPPPCLSHSTQQLAPSRSRSSATASPRPQR